MQKRPSYTSRRPVRLRRPGWLVRGAPREPYWCDLCQLGDAMFQPFIEALKARFSHRAADIDLRACIRTGQRLIDLDAVQALDAASGARADTGLRVMGNPVWRYQGSGVCVCEAVAGERIVLIYEPREAVSRHSAHDQEQVK
ncbi:hypothetical protein P3T24_006521 [Paraburkholderia sp. GAS33]|uniref:hypothetical protein n=1 Tax=Paraburkholderia sp. GAS33 TaxID=3035130 RepID=UPI003D26013B